MGPPAIETEWLQDYAPLAGSLGLSAIGAAVPIVLLGLLLAVWRMPAWRASLLALTSALVVALAMYGMPFRLAVAAAVFGAGFGLFPIGWIVFAAILLFDVSAEAGCLGAIERSLRALSGDDRMQVLLVAFAFGAFIEGTSGFGTPVAVSAALLAALGIPPFEAAALCLVANTAPVAFGALATPVVTLAGVTGLPLASLSATIGRLCPLIAIIIPMYLLVLLAGWRRAIEAWPAAAVAAVAFAVSQFLVSNYIGPYLTDIISALVAAGALVALLRVWQPAQLFRLARASSSDERLRAAASRGAYASAVDPPAPKATLSTARAWAPYAILVLLVLAWGSPWAVPYLDSASARFAVPVLDGAVERMPPVVGHRGPYPAVYTFNWLASAGTACFIAAMLAAAVTGIGLGGFAAVAKRTAHRLLLPELTIAAVLALAYVMNYSGATATLGLTAARTGMLFPFFSAFLGWMGVFLTGSDTSANALFGNLQMISARALSLNPVLMASVNSTGGVLGKMISIQSIAVAAAATRMPAGTEGRLFLFTLRHSLLLTAAMGIIAMLFAYVFPQAVPGG
jgi:lactate permease